MQTWRLLITLTTRGLKDLVDYLELRLNNGADTGQESEGNIAVLVPPSFTQVENNSSTENKKENLNVILNSLFSWKPADTILKQDNVGLLKTLSSLQLDEVERIHDDDTEFLADCIHQAADELSTPGNLVLQVSIFSGEKDLDSSYTGFIGALKRLEIWHHAFIGIVSNSDVNEVSDLHKTWQNTIYSELLSPRELHEMHSTKSIWNGSMNILLEKRSGYIPVRQCFLQAEDATKERLFYENVLDVNVSDVCNLVFDNHIEVVACVQQENIPFHMVCPHKFLLYSFSELQGNNNNGDFFKLCAETKGCWLMAFLKYGKKSKSSNYGYSKHDWDDYISQDFTQHLCINYSSFNLKQHCVVFIRHSPGTVRTLDAFFLHHRRHYNAQGFLNLLEKLDTTDGSYGESCDKGDDLIFYPNAAEYLHPTEWCEKTAWYLEETMHNIGRSLSRCKSDDFFMNGVPIVSTDSGKDDPKKMFPQFLSSFNVEGKAMTNDLQPIPVISDRLLKNLKTEEIVKTMKYKEAKKEIGHGIDYCLDSTCALRLDNRLTKVQKRYVPEDTLNLATFVENTNEYTPPISHPSCALRESTRLSTKNRGMNFSKVKLDEPKTKKPMTEMRESRSEKNKRRLRTLVDGVVYKYGRIKKEDEKYLQYCSKLFEICLVELKKLKSSAGLNDQMKQLAKDNLHKVIGESMVNKANAMSYPE